jgi:nicotinamidase-related amidase
LNEDLIEKYLETRRTMVPTINPLKSALLIIDMQKYQVRKEGSSYKFLNSSFPGFLDYFVKQVSEVVEPNIKRLVDFFRENDVKIVYTLYSSRNKDGSDFTRQIRTINEIAKEQIGDFIYPHKDHPGSKIIDSIKPEDDDLVLIKTTSSAFSSTNLGLFLQNMGIELLFIVGVATSMCVGSTARVAFDFGFDVIIIEDACADWSPEFHKNSLRSFERIYGSVMSTEEVIKKIKEKG